MTFPSSFHMPGTWNSEGVHPGLFRPPVSPNASPDYLVAPAFAKETSSRRKWNRRDSLHLPDIANHNNNNSNNDASYVHGEGFLGRFAAGPGPESKPYALAGRLSTSTMGYAMEDNGHLGESMFSDSDYRRALGSKRSRDQMEASDNGPTQLFHLPSKPAPVAGWGTLAFSAIGDVVGRVWEFCKIGSFKGFSAGGGVGFQVTSSGSITEVKSLPTPPAEDMYCFQAGPRQGEHVFDDGQRLMALQAGRYWHEMPQRNTGGGYATPSSPPAKRRQTDYKPELGRNWVMIREPGEAEEKKTPRKPPSSPWKCSPAESRAQASPATPTGNHRFATTPNARRPVPAPASTPRRPLGSSASNRPAICVSEAGSVKAQRPVSATSAASIASAASVASFASFAARSSPAPAVVSKIPVRAGTSTVTAVASMAGSNSATVNSASTPTQMNSRRRRNTAALAPSHSPPHRQRRANSAASLASNRVEKIDESSRLDAEAKHLATRRKMEERETDVRMSAFNRRLQDMIRQGQEALRTTIEVDMTERDEEEQDFGTWEDEL